MEKIIIIGSSGLAKEVFFIIKEINKHGKIWDFLGFIDNKNIGEKIIDGYSIIGDDDFAANECKGVSIAIAQGFADNRKNIYEFYKRYKAFSFPNLIHPGVVGDFDNIKMGESNIIAAQTTLSTGINIGHCNLINMQVVIAHDVRINDFCVINPGASISGNVTLRDGCLIGTNSAIHQGVEAAAGTTLGLGSVLTRNSKTNSTYLGNPAKKIM